MFWQERCVSGEPRRSNKLKSWQIRQVERARTCRAPQSSGAATTTPLRTLAAGLTQAARAAFAEPYKLAVERRVIHLRRLPRALDGLRIVQLSDIHHSPFTGSEQVERAVEMANSLQPDIIALTGDYVSHEREYAPPCAEMLGRLRPDTASTPCSATTTTGWTRRSSQTSFALAGIRVLNQRGHAL